MNRWPGGDGLTLAADAWGDAGGAPVILLHGGGQSRLAWAGTGRLLAERGYFAVAYDSRGHGDSDWPAGPDYELGRFAVDLAAVVQAIGATRPVVIGASHGGNTALAAVGEGRVEAAALVLVDVVPRIERAGFERNKAFMGHQPDGYASLEDVARAVDRFRGTAEQPGRTRNLAGLAKHLRLDAAGRYRWHWDPRFLDTRERDFAERAGRLEACARRLTVPALLVRGGNSDIVSEDGAREFLALAPQAEFVNIEGAGHTMAGDSNDAFSRALLDFLTRHVPAAAPER